MGGREYTGTAPKESGDVIVVKNVRGEKTT